MRAGFTLAQSPGTDEAEWVEVAEEFAPSEAGQLRVAVSKDIGRAFLAELNALPEHLAGAAWSGLGHGHLFGFSRVTSRCRRSRRCAGTSARPSRRRWKADTSAVERHLPAQPDLDHPASRSAAGGAAA